MHPLKYLNIPHVTGAQRCKSGFPPPRTRLWEEGMGGSPAVMFEFCAGTLQHHTRKGGKKGYNRACRRRTRKEKGLFSILGAQEMVWHGNLSPPSSSFTLAWEGREIFWKKGKICKLIRAAREGSKGA